MRMWCRTQWMREVRVQTSKGISAVNFRWKPLNVHFLVRPCRGMYFVGFSSFLTQLTEARQVHIFTHNDGVLSHGASLWTRFFRYLLEFHSQLLGSSLQHATLNCLVSLKGLGCTFTFCDERYDLPLINLASDWWPVARNYSCCMLMMIWQLGVIGRCCIFEQTVSSHSKFPLRGSCLWWRIPFPATIAVTKIPEYANIHDKSNRK